MTSTKTAANGIVPCEPDFDDPFAPKRHGRRLLECLHCGSRYTEDQVTFGVKPSASGMDTPVWWCPTPDCDGAGVGFDIHPVE